MRPPPLLPAAVRPLLSEASATLVGRLGALVDSFTVDQRGPTARAFLAHPTVLSSPTSSQTQPEKRAEFAARRSSRGRMADDGSVATADLALDRVPLDVPLADAVASRLGPTFSALRRAREREQDTGFSHAGSEQRVVSTLLAAMQQLNRAWDAATDADLRADRALEAAAAAGEATDPSPIPPTLVERTDRLAVGTCLVAHPRLADPCGEFDYTIVLITRYSPDRGTTGVIINKPLTGGPAPADDLASMRCLSAMRAAGYRNDRFPAALAASVPLLRRIHPRFGVYEGGPVISDHDTTYATLLHATPGLLAPASDGTGVRVRTVTEDLQLCRSVGAPAVARLADILADRDQEAPAPIKGIIGSSVWSPGQLEEEIERGDWYLCQVETDALLCHDHRIAHYRGILNAASPELAQLSASLFGTS
uniref:Uncharacterized protein n=1 Tax=Sexangularia sp. CB-2014 TaxID=1486929 RepID=A0A7S1VD54_9EUKA|mmetsp:Transcript_16577/g.51863  ORF Transcript_16577/g.51863 Transcript_16577/m.51863 type:complete len:422 (+) Transcript_16577:50-1315(+)